MHSIVPFGRGAWQHASERTGTPKPTRKKHIELSSHNGLETVTAAYCKPSLVSLSSASAPKEALGGDLLTAQVCSLERSARHSETHGLADLAHAYGAQSSPFPLSSRSSGSERSSFSAFRGSDITKLPHNSSTDFESSCVSITPRSGRPVGSCRALMTRLGRLRPCVERRTQILPTGSDRHTNGSAFWTTNRMPYQSRCTEAQKA